MQLFVFVALKIVTIGKFQAIYLLNKILSVVLKSYSYGTLVLEKYYSYLLEIREM